jgi:hypothetical protein
MSLSIRLDFPAVIKRWKDDLLGHSGGAMEAFKWHSRSTGVAWTKMTTSKSKKQA